MQQEGSEALEGAQVPYDPDTMPGEFQLWLYCKCNRRRIHAARRDAPRAGTSIPQDT